METVGDFIFGRLQNHFSSDGDCSHERRKAMTNLDSILKSRDLTLPAKVHLVKSMVFPVIMYGCESWTIKKAEPQRIDAFELWCWRRLLRIPWTAGRSNQCILKEIIGGTDAKAETPILWPPDVKNWLFGKDPDAGKDWRQEEKGRTRGWDDWMAWVWTCGLNESMNSSTPCRWTWVWTSSRCLWWTGKPGMWQSMGSQRIGHCWVTELQWTVW